MEESALVCGRVEVGIKVVRIDLAKLKSFEPVDDAAAKGSVVNPLTIRFLQIVFLLVIIRRGSNGY
jgi:hypothetical protein